MEDQNILKTRPQPTAPTPINHRNLLPHDIMLQPQFPHSHPSPQLHRLTRPPIILILIKQSSHKSINTDMWLILW